MKTVYPGNSSQHARFTRADSLDSGASPARIAGLKAPQSLKIFLDEAAERAEVRVERRESASRLAAQAQSDQASICPVAQPANIRKWTLRKTLAVVVGSSFCVWAGLFLGAYTLLG